MGNGLYRSEKSVTHVPGSAFVRLPLLTRAVPHDVPRPSSIDKSSNRSVRISYEYASRARLSWLKEYIEKLRTEVPRGPPGAFEQTFAMLAGISALGL
jgi:hypothetical protein